MKVYTAIGVMSGTSIDGLDIACCEITDGESWSYKILDAVTIPYSDKQELKLHNAPFLTAEDLIILDTKFGKFIGEQCKEFIRKTGVKPDLIASHGHTVFHQPKKGVTYQLGYGANIYAETKIPVICDFRRQDVAYGGQGAPLVPIGDVLLFGEYDACINLGGFANISTQVDKKRIAWDICAVNTILNFYAKKADQKFDNKGNMAANGTLNEDLLIELGRQPFYNAAPPKSLGIEWVNNDLLPLISKANLSVEDTLHTYCHHAAAMMAGTINDLKVNKVLVSGGGVYNDFLMNLLKDKCEAEFTIPNKVTIEYKEALIFALLGVLRLTNRPNILSSVTGAKKDHSSGVIFGLEGSQS